MKKSWMLLLSLLTFATIQAQDSDTSSVELTEEEYMALYEYYLDSISGTLSYDTGVVELGASLATLAVPKGFKYLNPEDTKMVLEDLWGNPPSSEPSLGMLFPIDDGPNTDSSFAIDITYSEEGYIDDSDASSIDYDELLETMREDTKLANERRVELGYEPVYLLGWASPPFYDEASKKLHWAKELRFGESESNTLNYNIRVLGRKGYMNLNVIGEMDVLPEVQANIDDILPSITFNEGNRYADFNPDLDKVAAYGIGGLIAGKVLAKTGLLATIGLFLAKAWKLLVVGAIAVFAGIRRLFGGKAASTEGKEEVS